MPLIWKVRDLKTKPTPHPSSQEAINHPEVSSIIVLPARNPRRMQRGKQLKR